MQDDVFNPINSLKLKGLSNHFNNIYKLYLNKKMPSVLLLSGEKGVGKLTLVHHLMNYIFDENHYDNEKLTINTNSPFYNQYKNKIFENIILFEKKINSIIKIDEIRQLKENISKTVLNDKPRFIILDEIENYNLNSLNALLKIIEEPSNNYFILVNNRSTNLLETIKSRSIEYNITLNENAKNDIKQFIVNNFSVKPVITKNHNFLSPGNYLHLNNLCENYNITLVNDHLAQNIEKILNLFKKEKNPYQILLLNYLIHNYFSEKILHDKSLAERIYKNKIDILNEINNFYTLNINSRLVINKIINKL